MTSDMLKKRKQFEGGRKEGKGGSEGGMGGLGWSGWYGKPSSAHHPYHSSSLRLPAPASGNSQPRTEADTAATEKSTQCSDGEQIG